MTETIFQKVAELIAESKKTPVEQITPDTTFQELGMDSLDGLSLVFELEETFDVSIPDDEAMKLKNVREVVESLEKLGVVA
jgi:acyl carrier protein